MDDILQLLSDSEIVDDYEILSLLQDEDFYYLKIKSNVGGDSVLYIKIYLSHQESWIMGTGKFFDTAAVSKLVRSDGVRYVEAVRECAKTMRAREPRPYLDKDKQVPNSPECRVGTNCQGRGEVSSPVNHDH